MAYENELKAALTAVRKASALCLKVLDQSHISSVEKKDQSPVSAADLGSQALVTLELLNRFPHDPIVGEEDADTLRNHENLKRKVVQLLREENPSIRESDILEAVDYGAQKYDPRRRFWTLDPIDGTKGFLRGEQFAVALSLLEGGKVVLGVLGCPNLMVDHQSCPEKGMVLWAVKGAGSFMTPMKKDLIKPVNVDSITQISSARFCESVEKAHASHDKHRQIADALGIKAAPCRMDSQVKYAALARGDASIYLRLPRSLDYREKIWDHAAGSIIVEEAGGRVTDFQGNSLQFDRGKKLESNVGILATNGKLHSKVLSAISNVL